MEYPSLKELDERYRNRGLRIISISQDASPALAGALARELEARFPVLHDAQGAIFRLYDIKSIPTNIFINREGRMVGVMVGFQEGALEKAVQDLIGKG